MTSKIGLEEHMDTIHDRKTFTCDICSKTIYLKSNMRKHMKTHGKSTLK